MLIESLIEGKRYWIKRFEKNEDFIFVNRLDSNIVQDNFETVSYPVRNNVTRKLLDICRGSNGLLFTMLLSVAHIYLGKKRNAQTIITGIPGSVDTISYIPLISDIDINSNTPFSEFLLGFKDNLTNALKFADFPLEAIIHEVDPNRKVADLFDISISMENIHGSRYFETATTPISIQFSITEGALEVKFKVNTKVIQTFDSARMMNQYLVVLDSISDNVNTFVSNIIIITNEEKEQILTTFNNTDRELPLNKMLTQLFEEQVSRAPERIAVQLIDKYLSYDKLNKLSNQLARKLRRYGVHRNSIVPIIMDRSLEMIVGIIGTLKSGGSYLPISPELPHERIEYMVRDSGAKILLTTGTEFNFDVPILNLNLNEGFTEDDSNVECINEQDDLAYVIYTSGSTGTPKGVMIEHRSLFNRINWMQHKYPITEQDIILHKTPFTFDVSIWELFWWQMIGAKMVLLPPNAEKDPKLIIDALNKYGVTVLHFVPSMLDTFLREIEKSSYRVQGIKYLFTSGEALNIHQSTKAQCLLEVQVANLYGPTEATIDVTYYNYSDDDYFDCVPIGKPIDNTRIYILDPQLNIQPIGVLGEICISGAGLARGYLNQPDLTAEKFIDNPYWPGERLYKTGDLGCWLPDGNIEYRGRMDHQVKLRGYRIELGEIETVLRKVPGIDDAAVLLQQDKWGDHYLAAYLLSPSINNTPERVGEIKSELRRMLPEYMLPTQYLSIDVMPVTPNGKRDRKALLQLEWDHARSSESAYEPPATEQETRMAEVWQDILGVEQIGRQDNFFERGGHSLKAVMLAARIHKEWDVVLPLQRLFEHPTLHEVVCLLDTGETEAYQSLPQAEKMEAYPLSSAQRRLIILEQLNGSSATYNMPTMLSLEGRVEVERIEKAIQGLIARHEALRTTFDLRGEEAVQIIHPDSNFELERMEGTGNVEEMIQAWVRPFDLGQAPLFRAALIRIEEERYILAMDIHHILSDGVSMMQLVREFSDLYQGSELEPLVVQYKDYAVWQKQELETERMKKQEAYWLERFQDGIPVAELTTDYPRPVVQSFEGRRLRFEMGRELTKQLRLMAEETGSTMYMVLLAAHSILLSKYTGEEDIVVGSPIAGRAHADVQQMIGVFINTLVMRSAPTGSKAFRTLLKEVKEEALGAYENQEYPFEELIEKLNVQRDMSRNPIFDTMLILQNMEQPRLKLGEIQVEAYPYEQKTSKFDLTIEVSEHDESLQIEMEYNTKLFREETIERMGGHYVRILEGAVANLDQPIGEIEMITGTEKEQILGVFNHTEAAYPKEKTIHALFEEQAEKTPNEIAVIYEEHEWTYRELNELANQWADLFINEFDVKSGEYIGVLMSKTNEMIGVLLGILKSGAAYIPLDPEYPNERVSYIIKDSELRMLITDTEAEWLDDRTLQVISINKHTKIRSHSPENPKPSSRPEDLAYIIYTSGSTGKPKGVMVEHRNVLNFFEGMDCRVPHDSSDVLLSVTSISFDISVLELFWTLTRGIPVIIGTEQSGYDQYLSNEITNLDFGLFFFSSYDVEKEKGKYKLLLDAAKFADQNEFISIWTPERHFNEFGGLFPNPAVTSAALAMITDKIGIRSGSVVAPLHHSARIAEEWAMVDNLSNGRVELAFASGWHADDFLLEPQNYSERVTIMYQQIDEIKKLWSGEDIEYTNGTGNKVSVRTYPRPIQSTLPVWITTAGNRNSFIKAGSIGANILTHLLGQDIEELKENIVAYRNSLMQSGFDPNNRKVALMLHTFIGDDLDEVKNIVKVPFCSYLRSSIGLIKNIAYEMDIDPSEFANSTELTDILVEVAFDRYWQSSALLGTKESCRKFIHQLSSVGIDELACLVDFGVNDDEVMKSLENLKDLKNEFTKGQVSVNSKVGQVTMMQTTPSRLKLLLTDPDSQNYLMSLRTVLLGGETLPDDILIGLRKVSNSKVINMYGPTETTVWSSTHTIDGTLSNNIIGKPIVNTQIYIMDKWKKLLPVGVIGEIYIGGDGVTRGYLNRDALTSERFVKHPFISQSKLYRTGDIGKQLEDGSIQYIGRMDSQVKINGYRIELGEIENNLLQYPDISQVVVTDLGNPGEVRKLAAFYVSDKKVSNQLLREFLNVKLPYYMVPSFFIKVLYIPLTPNGKINRLALQEKLNKEMLSSFSENTYDKPTTVIQENLLKVWKEVLGVEEIGIHDDFFLLGGDSIKVIQVASRLRKDFLELEIRDLFKYPTISALSTRVKGTRGIADQSLVYGDIPLTPMQLWFFDHYKNYSYHFNHSILLFRKEEFDEKIIKKVFMKIIEHHDALRIIFPKDSISRQFNRPITQDNEIFGWSSYDFTLHSNYRDSIGDAISELQGLMDLEKGPIIQLALFRTFDGDHLFIAIHHLIIDGISWRVIIEDLANLYKQAEQNLPVEIPLKTGSFRDWSYYLQQRSFEDEKAYWIKVENVEVKDIPVDQRMSSLTTVLSRISHSLDETITESLIKKANQAFGTEVNELLITALGLALRDWTGQHKFRIDLESHGREQRKDQPDFFRTVGWFTSLFPIIVDTSDFKDYSWSIKQMKEVIRAVPNKGVGYGTLKYLSAIPELNNGRQSQILFNYLGQIDQDTQFDVFQLSDIDPQYNVHSETERVYKLEINSIVREKQLVISIDFDSAEYEEKTVKHFLALMAHYIKEITQECSSREHKELTPSDLSIHNKSLNILWELLNDSNVQDIYELSPMQQGILYHSALEGRGNYFQQFVLYGKGRIEVDMFGIALNHLAERHDSLRTNFLYRRQQQFLQVVLREQSIPLEFIDASYLTDSEKNSDLEIHMIKDRDRYFDLEQDPLLRVTIFKESADSFRIVFSYHHIIMDGWCMGVLSKELMSIYDSILNSSVYELPLPKQYGIYINWLNHQSSEDASNYWRSYLDGYHAVKESKVGIFKDYQSETVSLKLDEEVSELLQQTANRNKVTLNTLFVSLWGILQQKLNYTRDVVFGSVVSGRPSELEGVEDIIGLFINTTPVRVTSQKEMKFSELLVSMQESLLESDLHSYHPLYEIQGNQSYFDHILIFENYPLHEEMESSSTSTFTVSNIQVFEQTNYDLNVVIQRIGACLELKINFNRNAYEESYVHSLLNYLFRIIQSVLQDDNLNLDTLDMVSDHNRLLQLEDIMDDLDLE